MHWPETKEFFDNLLLLQSQNKIDKALYSIFDYIDELLLKGDFGKVDLILFLVDIPSFNIDLLLSFLTITSAARQKLYYREDFLEDVKKITIERGEMEKDLFSGL